MKNRKGVAVIASLFAVACVQGCATTRYDEARSARGAYDDCVDGWGANHERCTNLHERLQEAEARYRNPAGTPSDDNWGGAP